MRPIDIDRAYAYCKGALTPHQREKVNERRRNDEEFDQLIEEIEELFSSMSEDKVQDIINSWKLSRVDYNDDDKNSSASANTQSEHSLEDQDELKEILVQQHQKKRLQKAYIIVAVVLTLLILSLLIWYFI